MKLLLAEDDVDLSLAICKILKLNKYDVEAVYDGEDALFYLLNGNYDGAIIDVMMPKLDGFSVVKKARIKGNSTPILILTAKSEVDDKVEGLDSGADDYLTKPFEIKELLARVRALVRRSFSVIETYSYEDIILNSNTYELVANNSSVRLTNKEYKLMELFIRNKNCYLSSEKIMESIWEFDSDAEINVVWVYISTLRKKLEQLNSKVTIKAARGVGYKLEGK